MAKHRPYLSKTTTISYKSLALAFTLILLSACEMHANYAEQGKTFFSPEKGYRIGKIKEDIYEIRFKGGTSNSQQYIDAMCLKAAADTAIKNNYSHFKILFKQKSFNPRSISNPIADSIHYTHKHKMRSRRLQIQLTNTSDNDTIDAKALLEKLQSELNTPPTPTN